MSQKMYTYEDYYQSDEKQRCEIIDGVIYMMAGPSRQHQRVLWELSGQFWNYLRGKPCQAYAAPFDVRLPLEDEDAEKPKNVVQPDLVVICDERKLDARGCLGAPDLIVEILSPSTAMKDLLMKKSLYEKAGVLEYWVFDPVNSQVSILRLENDRFGEAIVVEKEEVLTTPLLPDLNIDLAEVFKE